MLAITEDDVGDIIVDISARVKMHSENIELFDINAWFTPRSQARHLFARNSDSISERS